MRGNTVTVILLYGFWNKTHPLYQYDYGQKLIIDGVDLPQAYEVHFSNSDFGNSRTSIGNSEGVDIPDELLLSGEDIKFWIYLHKNS